MYPKHDLAIAPLTTEANTKSFLNDISITSPRVLAYKEKINLTPDEEVVFRVIEPSVKSRVKTQHFGFAFTSLHVRVTLNNQFEYKETMFQLCEFLKAEIIPGLIDYIHNINCALELTGYQLSDSTKAFLPVVPNLLINDFMDELKSICHYPINFLHVTAQQASHGNTFRSFVAHNQMVVYLGSPKLRPISLITIIEKVKEAHIVNLQKQVSILHELETLFGLVYHITKDDTIRRTAIKIQTEIHYFQYDLDAAMDDGKRSGAKDTTNLSNA